MNLLIDHDGEQYRVCYSSGLGILEVWDKDMTSVSVLHGLPELNERQVLLGFKKWANDNL